MHPGGILQQGSTCVAVNSFLILCSLSSSLSKGLVECHRFVTSEERWPPACPAVSVLSLCILHSVRADVPAGSSWGSCLFSSGPSLCSPKHRCSGRLSPTLYQPPSVAVTNPGRHGHKAMPGPLGTPPPSTSSQDAIITGWSFLLSWLGTFLEDKGGTACLHKNEWMNAVLILVLLLAFSPLVGTGLK